MRGEILIIGGGLIGSSIGWRLAQKGAQVTIADAGKGVMVLLNCSESASQLIDRVAEASRSRPPSKMNLLTYGIGAQILRDLNVGKMKLLAAPLKLPSMAGFELEIGGFVQAARRKSRGHA